MKVHLSFALLLIAINWTSLQKIDAQNYNFSEIRENLLIHRPQTGDQEIRENSICSIDNIVLSSYVEHKNEVFEFYSLMLAKAMIEIRTENVEEGVTVWQIYNHGFVVKTPTVVLCFDLYDYIGFGQNAAWGLEELADIMDVMFISHDHNDHTDSGLSSAMRQRNKPVIEGIDPATDPSSISINVGDSINEAYLHITDHEGLHSTTIHMFEVVTPEGFKILHTGDNQTSETIPDIEGVDILLLNAWVNESGWTSHITGSRNAIKKINPRVTLPGHILELGHLGRYIVPYSDVFMVDDIDLGSELCVLAWGERYHLDNASNDSVSPNPVADPLVNITNHDVNISWDPPPPAGDGESPSFYRIIRENTGEYFTTNRQFSFAWDSMGNYPIKLFSYDDCGNQCLSPLEFTVTVPDVNYAPHIVSYDPSFKDTTDVFAGVYKVFSVMVKDPNNDPVTYSWQFDGNPLPDESENYFIYDFTLLDPGIHWLTVIVSDQQLSEQHTWLIDHQNHMAVVDNSDTLMYSEHGSWRNCLSSNACNGSMRCSHLYNVGDWARYLYYPEVPGYYDVHAYIPDVKTGSDHAVYYVLINDEPFDTIVLDQVAGRGKWLELGQYYLTDTAEIQIRVVNIDGKGNVYYDLLADAIRLTHIEDSSMIQRIKNRDTHRYFQPRCYPNPAINQITIEISIPGRHFIEIISLNGRLLDSKKVEGPTHQIDLSSFQRGLYFITVRSKDYVRTEKIIKL